MKVKFENLGYILIAFCCLFFQPAIAQNGAAPLKVGYVDYQAIAAKSPWLADEGGRLEKEFSARKKAIREKELALSQLQERFQKEGRTMQRGDLKKLEDQMLTQDRQIRWEKTILEDDSKRQYNQLMAEFEQNVNRAILAIAKQENFDLILKDGVLMSSSRVNLTERVLTELKNSAAAKKK